MTPLEQANAILKAAEVLAQNETWPELKYPPVTCYEHHEALMLCGGEDPDKKQSRFRDVLNRAMANRDEMQGKWITKQSEARTLALALIEKHRALEEALELFRSICSAYENQDLNHVDFRVKCAELAQDFLARQGATA